MTINKYERIQKSLYEAFTKFVVGFAKKAKTKEEEKIMISMAKEIWNISYLNKKAQEEEIEEFVNSLKIEESKLSIYRNMMIQGIRDKKKATKNYDLKDVWTRVEDLKVCKVENTYKIEFQLDFYE